MLSLDIGCGEIGLCDINCDIKKPDRIPYNFVLCDSQKLPFRSGIIENGVHVGGCFNFVETFHVIEHVKNPYLFLSEIKRVLIIGGMLKLICPHRFSSGAKNEGHIHFFNRKWFENNLIGCRASAIFIPHLLIQNIKVRWRKTKND